VKTLLLSIAWLALSASIASAGGISLAWNDCLGAGGASNRTFACDTNVGFNDLYVSFDPPVDLPDVNGLNAIIDLNDLSSSVLPGWWQFKNAGSCRRTALSSPTTIAGSCDSIWTSQPFPGIAAYFVTAVLPSMPPNYARILTSISVPIIDAAAVHPGTEYTAQVIRIDNTKTAGLGACGGCQEQICLVVSEVLLTTNNSGDLRINCGQRPGDPCNCPGAPGTFVSWQGSNTPTLNRTWGQLKSLYR
jgi:hypothetical protein